MDNALWLGTIESAAEYVRFQQYMADNPKALAEMAPAMFLPNDEDEDNPMQPKFDSHLLESFGNVAVMNISGGLTNEDTWITRLFGLTTYPEIIRASAELMEASDITDVVLNFDTAGGAVAGLEDAGRALAALGKSLNMVSATSGKMASAGYWLAATGKSVSATPMAQVGSIGVIAAHMSYKDHLEQQGIHPTVFRAGAHKAPGHPLEKLTPEAKETIQGEMDSMYSFFLEHIAEERGLDVKAKDTWAEGRMFFGQEAMDVGLADNMNPPEAVIAKLEKQEPSNNPTQMNGDTLMSIEAKRQVLLKSEADIAALAAGAPLESLDHVELTPEQQADADAAAKVEADAAAALLAEGGEPQLTDAEIKAKADADAAAAALAAPAAPADTALVSQLATLSAENALLKRDLEGMTAQRDGMKADSATMVELVGAAVNRMEIGMKQAVTNFGEMGVSAVIAKHSSVKEQFDSTFKIGRQSAHTDITEQPNVINLGIIPKAK